MLNVDLTKVEQQLSLPKQVAVAALVAYVGMGVCQVGDWGKGQEYMAVFIGVIFYTVMNTVLSLAHKSYTKYTLPSYAYYLGMTAVLLLSAKLLSGISIWDLWEYRMMLVSITLFYFVVSSFVRAIRFILEFAQSDY
jgi:hypothetical protein